MPFNASLMKGRARRNHLAGATSPTLVHIGSVSAFSAAASINFSPTPTTSNLLLVTVFYPGGQTPTATPAGWTAIDGSGQSTTRPIQMFMRKSDGTETSFNITYSGSAAYGIYYSEWSGATTVAPSTGSSVASGTSTPTLGPSAAPPVAGALPLFFSASRNAVGHIASVPAGWTLPIPNNTNYVPAMTYKQIAPGSAVSETLTLDATTTTFYQWASTWIY